MNIAQVLPYVRLEEFAIQLADNYWTRHTSQVSDEEYLQQQLGEYPEPLELTETRQEWLLAHLNNINTWEDQLNECFSHVRKRRVKRQIKRDRKSIIDYLQQEAL